MQGTRSRPSLNWRSLLGDIGLAALISGPIAAPFLAASAWPLLTDIANIIYTMGEHVCPQPELGVPLAAPHIMAVCMRCYGTVLGLGIMRWLYHRTRGQGTYWLEQYGLLGFVLTFILCLAYPLELAMQGFDWWGVHHGAMTLFGLIAGLGLGAYLMPLLHQPASENG
ncbi:hypothetical protein XM38_021420 [Halomicronema hongdechloris C2206]|uniref:DUF2085 domain-containing protein n=1 Tax=Halomicronema hongdechloris C2206 TaxID=1641165 RepID=A0A1Z3HLM2_9CYAN|nr:DUF2085 domain-containing protein [Halomicronema hongdechloris]ASC71190.1 hypothetical protein XM38_021420 [Halomicronema hongdechloris C2206]